MIRGCTIGVVTVTYNSASVVAKFLECVLQQTLKDCILYVVDNASTDKTLEIVSEFEDPRVAVIANKANLGIAEGNNQGIKAAMSDGCECILLINNDTEFPADLFAQLYKGLGKYQCDMTTGKIYYYGSPDVIWSAGGRFAPERFFNTFHDGMGEKDVGQYDDAHLITFTPMCLLLARRSVFERVGLIDTNYFVYTEDVDFLYRCMQQSVSLWYVPEAKLYHKVSSLTGGDMSTFSVRHMTRNRMYFLRKHRPVWEAVIWGVHLLTYTAPYRVLFGRDSVEIWRLRCAAVFEGWAMYSRTSGNPAERCVDTIDLE